MKLFIMIISILVIGIPLLVGLLYTFFEMFDDVFGTNISLYFLDLDILLKSLSISGMLLILSLPVFVICYFLGILN